MPQRLNDKGDAPDGEIRGLEQRMENGFNRLDADLREQRGEIAKRLGKVDERFGQIDKRFEELTKETKNEFTAVRQEMKAGFDRLQHILLGASGIVIAALIGPHL